MSHRKLWMRVVIYLRFINLHIMQPVILELLSAYMYHTECATGYKYYFGTNYRPIPELVKLAYLKFITRRLAVY